MPDTPLTLPVAVIGAGPAGLMAAETIARAGLAVTVFDAMPTPGRKLLRAGIGGLNLTHAEEFGAFVSRYGEHRDQLLPLLEAFGPEPLQAWAHALGIATFVGSSQRVFPQQKKAAPLLRAWLRRLAELNVTIRTRHRWLGWQDGLLRFTSPAGEQLIKADAVVLALGGASWPQLGSDGSWASLLKNAGIDSVPFQPANCGFQVTWSDHFRERYQRQPVKAVRGSVRGQDGTQYRNGGELMIAKDGLEGGLIYSLSAPLRQQLEAEGDATLWLDLAPDRTVEQLEKRLSEPRGRRSQAKHLKDKAGITGVKAGLLREFTPVEWLQDPQRLAQMIKALPVPVTAPMAIERAISTAGGIAFESLTPDLMVRQHPGLFCAGEMLDWEAPTGGYLLTACFATGVAAGQGVIRFLKEGQPSD